MTADLIAANNKAINDPTIGSRLFNNYGGKRSEKPDLLENFGKVYIYCLYKAVGNDVKFIEGKPCEIKTAHLALRILFGLAAFATLPFTLVGVLLTALSKTQKKAHQEALNSLKPKNEPKVAPPATVEVEVSKKVVEVAKAAEIIPPVKQDEKKEVLPPKPQEGHRAKIIFILPEAKVEEQKLLPPPEEVKKQEEQVQKVPQEEQKPNPAILNQNIDPQPKVEVPPPVGNNPEMLVEAKKVAQFSTAYFQRLAQMFPNNAFNNPAPIVNPAPKEIAQGKNEEVHPQLKSILDHIWNVLLDAINRINEAQENAEENCLKVRIPPELHNDPLEEITFKANCCEEIQNDFFKKVKAIEIDTNFKIDFHLRQNQEIIDRHKTPSFTAAHEGFKLNLQNAFKNLRIERADNAKAEAVSLKEMEKNALDFAYEKAMALNDDFSEGKSEEEAEKVVVENPPAKENVNPPKKLIILRRDDLAGVKAFIAENPSQLKPLLLEDCLRNSNSTPLKINDSNQDVKNVILHLIDELEKMKVPIFDHQYSKDDALSLAITWDRTDKYKIISRLVAYLKNPANSAKIPLNKEKYLELANKQAGAKKDIVKILEKFCGKEKSIF